MPRKHKLRVKRPPRVLQRIPVVYLGPAARAGIGAGPGVVLGAHRTGWVDVLSYQPLESARWQALVDRRFSRPEAIGIVVSPNDLTRARRGLAKELVPGDVVLVAGQSKKPRCYVNRGDELVVAPLRVSRASDW